MARLTLNLNQFKASGIYTVEIDESEIIIINSEVIRLVVGFSRIGPFNAPVFLRDTKDARKTFGAIDIFLEQKGSFFHRSLETALLSGPVYALNLLPLNNIPLAEGGDGADYQSFSLSVTEENPQIQRELFTAYYNQERFWFASTRNLDAIVDTHLPTIGSLLTLTNLSQRQMSFIVKKPDNLLGYSITAAEWYGNSNVPDFIDPFDFIVDYFIEITAIQGDWTDYDRLSKDPIFSKYFDSNGLKYDQLNNFAGLEGIVTLGTWTGCVIPGFVDKEGTNQYIKTLVNQFTGKTGILLSVNEEQFADYANSVHKIDMIGHSFIGSSDSTMNWLSYNQAITEKLDYDATALNTLTSFDISTWMGSSAPELFSRPLGGDNGLFNNVIRIPKPQPNNTVFKVADYENLIANITDISLIKTNGSSALSDDDEYIKVDEMVVGAGYFDLVLSHPYFDSDDVIYTNSPDGKGVEPGSLKSLDATTFVIADAADDFSYLTATLALVEGGGLQTYFWVTATNDATDTTWTVSADVSALITVLDPASTVEYSLQSFVDLLGVISLSDITVTILDPTGAFAYSPALKAGAVADDWTTMEIVYAPNTSSNVASSGIIEYLPAHQFALDANKGLLASGDAVYDDTNTNYLKLNKNSVYGTLNPKGAMYGLIGVSATQYKDVNLTVLASTATSTAIDESGFADSAGTLDPSVGTIVYSSNGLDISVDITVLSSLDNKVVVSEADAVYFKVGYFLINVDGDSLTRITSVVKGINATTGAFEYTITTVEDPQVPAGVVTVYTPINNFATNLNFKYLSGFAMTDWHLPGTELQMDKIYSVITDTNLELTLASVDIISFRYIVDTMDFGIEPSFGGKSVLTRLAKSRQKCMALINTPSLEKLQKHVDPRFTDLPDPSIGQPYPTLQAEYIASGGNLDVGPSYLMTLPDEEDGSKYFGTFTPFLIYRTNGVNRIIPPAADVSNNFINKFNNGQPYAIAAGPRRGIISNPDLVGVEYEYVLQDREFLEPAGFNPIILDKRGDVMIYADQTGYQRITSALNNLHVRDLLISIEIAIEDILSNFIFEFNDATTRLEIKSIVEKYLDDVKAVGGIYDFFVVMDTTNNKPEIIDQNFAILDVGIEPARGMNKVINRLRILGTNQISSGGFTLA